MTQRIHRAWWGVARALFGFALLAWVLDLVDFEPALVTRNAKWLLAFAAFPFLGAAVEALRLRWLFRAARVELEFAVGYRLVLAAFAFNLCLPGSTGGDLLKLVWLGGLQAGRRVEVATLVLVDRAIGMLGFMLVGAGLAALQAQRVAAHALLTGLALWVASLAAVGVGAVWSAPHLAPALVPRLERIPRVGAVAARAVLLIATVRHQGGALAKGTLISGAAQVVLLTCYALAARSLLGSDLLPMNALLAFFGLLANMLPVTPGGMGVGEVAFDRLFGLIGVEGGAALSMLGRLGLIPAFAVGLALYVSGVHRARLGSSLPQR